MARQSSSMVLQRAQDLIEKGDCRTAFNLLAPLLEQGSPEAQFLFSKFSIAGGETPEQFETRSINLLQVAAGAGYAPAMFALAVCLDSGDMVARDCLRAARLFKLAAEGGYSKAKLSYGLDLIHGSNGMPKNRARGVALLEQAVAENVDGAAEVLDQLSRGEKGAVSDKGPG